MSKQFELDVLEGLSQAPKSLSSKYFYDKKGDKLFQEIMALPEYYLTRAEMEIFTTKTQQLVDCLASHRDKKFELIELGAGDGVKTYHLLRKLVDDGIDFEFVPVDISQNALDGLVSMLNERIPELKVNPRQGDYFDQLEELKLSPNAKVVLILGSNIGNLLDHQATEFIYQLGAFLSNGDQILLGVDLIKDKDIVLPAYNDAQGVTAAFNLNLLERINRELNANFDLDQFSHQPEYDKAEGVAKSFLVSKIDQTVTVQGNTFDFQKGEKIHTEISRKYSDEIIDKILSPTDITREKKITDSNEYFADYVLRRN